MGVEHSIFIKSIVAIVSICDDGARFWAFPVTVVCSPRTLDIWIPRSATYITSTTLDWLRLPYARPSYPEWYSVRKDYRGVSVCKAPNTAIQGTFLNMTKSSDIVRISLIKLEISFCSRKLPFISGRPKCDLGSDYMPWFGGPRSYWLSYPQ